MRCRCRVRFASTPMAIRCSPELVQRIASISSPKARWIKVGHHAATLAVRDIAFLNGRSVCKARSGWRRGDQRLGAGIRARRGRGRRQGTSIRGQRRIDGVEMVRQARAPVAATNRCGVAPFAGDARDLYLSRSGFDTAFGSMLRGSRRRSRPARRKISRRLPPPSGRPKSTRRSGRAARSVGVKCLRRYVKISRGIDARLSPDLREEILRNFSRDVSGWRASRSGIPSASTTRSEGTGGVADTGENAGARYSSSSSTAIRNTMRRR